MGDESFTVRRADEFDQGDHREAGNFLAWLRSLRGIFAVDSTGKRWALVNTAGRVVVDIVAQTLAGLAVSSLVGVRESTSAAARVIVGNDGAVVASAAVEAKRTGRFLVMLKVVWLTTGAGPAGNLRWAVEDSHDGGTTWNQHSQMTDVTWAADGTLYRYVSLAGTPTASAEGAVTAATLTGAGPALTSRHLGTHVRVVTKSDSFNNMQATITPTVVEY